MASRWAFEASMVTQFKDNDFEREFYRLDKAMADADFKKVYLFPEIETKLQYCLNNYQSTDQDIRAKVVADFEVIRNEVSRLCKEMNQTLPALASLTVEKFSPSVNNDVLTYLESLKKVYMHRFNQADKRKEDMIAARTKDNAREFTLYRERYHNDAIADLVKNISETHRIIEKDGKLIQKIYPIYKDPDPDHPIDFDAQFYMPAKHFLNRDIDTFYFNTGVIWSMTFVLALLLYMDVLRRIIDGFGNLSNPLHRRK
jgi:ABC transport system ATP-binding/permease protein